MEEKEIDRQTKVVWIGEESIKNSGRKTKITMPYTAYDSCLLK